MKMAAGNYNELTHTQDANVNSLDPLYKWDTHFPERLSKLHLTEINASPTARRTKRQRNRNASRYKTQPITFDEIKEVDEDNNNPASPDTSDSIDGIRHQFAAFSKSMDGLLPGAFPQRVETKREPSTDSNKENNPSERTSPLDASASSTVGCVLGEKSSAEVGNSSSKQKTSSAESPSAASATITDIASGIKIPGGLPTDAGRSRRKPRKKNRGIVEEPVLDADKNSIGSNLA